MRATAWTGSRAARGAALGFSLLAGLVALGGAGAALAQGMANPMGGPGYRSGKAAPTYRHAARPGPAMKGYAYKAAPRAKGYKAAPRAKGYGYRKRARGYRPAAPKTCGEFRYWSSAKGRCMDARTSPPTLKR